MNILMLNYEYPPLGGGAGIATACIINEFLRYPDLTIDLITSSTGARRTETPGKNITVHFLDIGKRESNLHFQSIRDLLVYSWKAYRYARRLTGLKQYDLVHAIFGVPSGLVALFLGRPFLISLRGSDVPYHTPRF
ncbi:MAG: glycosyltransferase, partial [Candidatus Omnitrophica bacterium]|nr:glycosyltransferase [Candidatus Omnitrophota bacterium]